MVISTIISSLVFFAVYFFSQWSLLYAQNRGRTQTEKYHEQAFEAQRKAGSLSTLDQVELTLHYYGYNGGSKPILAISVFLYILGFLVFKFLSFGTSASFILSTVCLTAVIYLLYISRQNRQLSLFNRQFSELLPRVATQLEDGNSLERSLQIAAEEAENPLKNELEFALNQASRTKNFTTPFTNLSLKYPSHAITLFLASMKLSDENLSASFAPTLKAIASSARIDREIEAELQKSLIVSRTMIFMVLLVSIPIFGFVFFKTTQFSQLVSSSVSASLFIMLVFSFLFGGWRVYKIFQRGRVR